MGGHWSDYLVTGLPDDRDTEVTITVDPSRDHSAVVVLASRLRGLVDALRQRALEVDAPDPLEREHPDDLYFLLDHLHRVRMVLEAQEERVLRVAHRRGVSLRRLAAALEVSSPSTVSYRLEQIERAARHGLSAAKLDDDPMAAGEPIARSDPED
jgi:hypothetical protein